MGTVFAYLFFVGVLFTGELKSSETLNIESAIVTDTTYSLIRFNPRIHFMFDSKSKSSNLSDQEISLIKQLVKQSVEDYNFKLSKDTSSNKIKSLLNLSSYKKQLIAVTNLKGEKEVFVNCICTSDIPKLFRSGINWQKEYFKVNDGGSCYFRVFLNLTNGRYYGFRVNGHA